MRLHKFLFAVVSIAAISVRPGNAQDSKIPFTISPETTHITEPVGEDGLIDYIEALSRRQREGVTPDNNSVVLFRRALGHREVSDDLAEEYFKQLGMNVLPKDGNYLIGTQEYVDSLDISVLPQPGDDESDRRQLVLMQHGEAQTRPWTRAEFPLVAGWIDTNQEPLTFVVEGSNRPKYFSPLLPNDGMLLAILLPDAQNSREFARLLSTRAMLMLGEGDLEAAWRDVMTCHRIARLTAQGPTLIDLLVGVATESIACQCDRHVAQFSLTGEQARRFSNELRELGFIGGTVDRIDTAERYMYLDAAGKVAVYGIDVLDMLTESEGSAEGSSTIPTLIRQAILKGLVDWDVVLQMGNESYDRIVKAGRLPMRLERQPELDKLRTELKEMQQQAAKLDAATLLGGRPAVSRKFGMIMISLMVPAVAQVFEAEDRCRMRTQLSHFAFALAAWRADHGEFPEELEQLTPKYLQSIPIDTYTGKSLVYRRSDSGYLLYGIGPNLKDDGGFTFGEGTDTDDLVVRSADEDQRIREAAEEAKAGK